MDDAEQALMMEISENECRKEFTKTERLEYARRLAQLEKAKSEQGKRTDLAQDVVQGERNRAANAVAQALGTNRETLRQEQFIVDNADQRIGELLRELPKAKAGRKPNDSIAVEELPTKAQAIKESGISTPTAYQLEQLAANPVADLPQGKTRQCGLVAHAERLRGFWCGAGTLAGLCGWLVGGFPHLLELLDKFVQDLVTPLITQRIVG